MLPKPTLLLLLLLAVTTLSAQASRSPYQRLSADQPKKKRSRRLVGESVKRVALLNENGKLSSLNMADDPASRFERLILTPRAERDKLLSFTHRHQQWMKDIAWADSLLHILLPLSLLDIPRTRINHSILNSLFKREVELREILADAQGQSAGKAHGHIPPLYLQGSRMTSIRESYKGYTSTRILLPSLSAHEGEISRIIPAYANGMCSSDAAFDILIPSGFHISVISMVTLRRLIAWVEMEGVSHGEREARKVEGGKIRTHVLAYVHCLRNAVQWRLSTDQGRWKESLTRLVELIEVLEKATAIEGEQEQRVRALSALLPTTMKEAKEVKDTKAIGAYGKRYAVLFEESIGQDAGEWKRWKILLKITYVLIDRYSQIKVGVVLSTDSPPSAPGRRNVDRIAGGGLCGEVERRLKWVADLLAKNPQERTSHLARHLPERVNGVAKLLPLLRFRLMQMRLVPDVPLVQSMLDHRMDTLVENWTGLLRKLESATEEEALQATFAEIQGPLHDFCSPDHISPAKEIEDVTTYLEDRSVAGAKEKALLAMQSWRQRLFGALLDEFALIVHLNNPANKARSFHLTRGRGMSLMRPMIVSFTKTASIKTLKAFFDAPYKYEDPPMEAWLGELGGFALAAGDFIMETAWKGPRSEKESIDLQVYILKLLRLADEAAKDVLM